MNTLRGKLASRSGLTIIEMAVVMTIAAIVMTGLLIAYADGVREWRFTTDRMVLHDEGRTALSLMGRFIRQASFIKIKSYSGLSNASVELKYPEEIGGGSAKFYFIKDAGVLKWNDQTEGRNKFNMRLLPAVTFRGEPGDPLYMNVKRARFTPLDDVGFSSPTLQGYSLIKIELILEDAREDTLYLSSVISKRN
jgi:prepilin-type N-terminal cleavage/methylation domain-containing protein